jgi:phospholipase/lecithinase/hemolysin
MKTPTFTRWLQAAAFVGATLCAQGAHAAFTSLSIFGDSLSDTGNVFAFSAGTQPPPGQPYAGGGFSNGPLWTDLLATSLGFAAAANPSLAGGTNYAWAGARTNGGSIPSTQVQVLNTGAGFWGGVAADPTGLYVLVAGGNDMRDARTAFPTNSAADQAGRQAAANTAASALTSTLSAMAAKGVKNVLLSSLPDLGNTPEAVALGVVAASTDASSRFNVAMTGVVSAAIGLGLNVSFLDMAGVANAIRNDALFNGGAVYGITNVLTPCAGFTGSTGISCNVSAFSDALHPSARTHLFIAAAAVTAVPEPAPMAMLAAGVLVLLAVSRRRAAATRQA